MLEPIWIPSTKTVPVLAEHPEWMMMLVVALTSSRLSEVRVLKARQLGSLMGYFVSALVVSGFKPATPVEFHFYSGEEAGLLGSQAIAKSYSTAGTSVKAMLQLDMTAWVSRIIPRICVILNVC